MVLDYESLLELIILEDVKNSKPMKIRSHVEERGLRHMSDIGPVADHYGLTNPYFLHRSRESTASHSGQVKDPFSGGSRMERRVVRQQDSQTRGGWTSHSYA